MAPVPSRCQDVALSHLKIAGFDFAVASISVIKMTGSKIVRKVALENNIEWKYGIFESPWQLWQ